MTRISSMTLFPRSTRFLVLLLLILGSSVSHAGVYYVVHRLVRQPDGSVVPTAGASFLVQERTRPSALELARRSAAEEAKKPDVVRTWVVKEGEGYDVVVETDGDPNLVAKNPPSAVDPPSKVAEAANDRLQGRLKRVKRDLEQTLYNVARVRRNSVNNAVSRVRRLGRSYDGIVGQLNNDNFKEINGMVEEYNRIADELGTGPFAESFTDFRPLNPTLNAITPEAQLSPKEAQEKLMAIQTKLQEADLRLANRFELEEPKAIIETERQKIAADKANGIEDGETVRNVAAAIKAWDAEKQSLAKKTDEYRKGIATLESLRTDNREEKKVAQDRKLAEERRRNDEAGQLAEKQRRDEQRMAEQRRMSAANDSLLPTGAYSAEFRSGGVTTYWRIRVGDGGSLTADLRSSRGDTGQAFGNWKIENRRVMIRWTSTTGAYESQPGKEARWMDVTEDVKNQWRRVVR